MGAWICVKRCSQGHLRPWQPAQGGSAAANQPRTRKKALTSKKGHILHTHHEPIVGELPCIDEIELDCMYQQSASTVNNLRKYSDAPCDLGRPLFSKLDLHTYW